MYKIAQKLAFKSLFRRKTRTMLVILMIALSLSGLLVLQGLYDGMITHMINTTIRSDSGEISIYAKKYHLEKNLDYRINAYDNIITQLKKIPDIDAYTIRLSQDGLVATAHKSMSATLKGISLEDEKKFGTFETFLTQGAYSFGVKNNQALIGSKLAKKLNITLGSRIIFTAQDANAEINSISFRISGIVKTGNMAVDENSIFISMEQMSLFLGLNQSATQIALRINDPVQLKQIQSKLQKHFTKLDIFRWDELYPLLIQMRDITDIFNFASYIIVFLVAGLGIFGVILVSILERMREFSIMLAIGTPYRSVRIQVIIEAVAMAFLGYLAGAVLGWILLSIIATTGIDLRYFQDGLESFGLNAILYADMHSYYFLQAFLAVILATFLSLLWPLRMLKKINPIQVIQGKMI